MQTAFGATLPRQFAGSGAENRTGMPDALKAGIESLSGMDMSDVRVHRESDRPAQLDAFAYAQGKDIHLAPGQEQHLAHDAWHVAQQSQGRVNPTMKSEHGVPINDDEGLEREADAMGALAVQGGSEPAQRRVRDVLPGSPPVQRQVHEWKEDSWFPGPSNREGKHQLPQAPEGDKRYFNDVTGMSAASASAAGGTLTSLSVKEGSTPDLMANLSADGGVDMAKIDGQLRSAFAVPANCTDSQILALGYFTFSGGEPGWAWRDGGDNAPSGEWRASIETFLKNFMAANGQLDYLRTRDWFRNGTHSVEIDVNYYMNRAFGNAPLYWHKDTGGGNIFVNLIFLNTQDIIATEVSPDHRPMGEVKKASLLANMPPAQVDEIAVAREELLQSGQTGISGGILPSMAYLSWVDELSWHSSPYMDNRLKWTKEDATKVMGNWVGPRTDFKDQTATSYEAMVLIARTEGTQLNEALKHEPLKLDYFLAERYFNGGYRFGGKYEASLSKDLAEVPWADHKVNSAFGHEQDGDDPRVKMPQGYRKPATLITPSGMEGRQRALSDAERRLALTQKVKSLGGEGRNFLRTWVRIKPIPKK